MKLIKPNQFEKYIDQMLVNFADTNMRDTVICRAPRVSERIFDCLHNLKCTEIFSHV